MKILFLGKKNDLRCSRALNHLLGIFPDVEFHLGDWGDQLPVDAFRWEGDIVISYLSRWIVPASILNAAKQAAINFHPAPPEYPGVGCFNFAIYDGVKEFGVTCHHMDKSVDTGRIIAVDRFPLLDSDCVATLLERTHDCLLKQFLQVIDIWAAGQKLPKSREIWMRKPMTRKQLDELSIILPSMGKDEIERRIRATSYNQFQPYLELYGLKFVFFPEDQ